MTREWAEASAGAKRKTRASSSRPRAWGRTRITGRYHAGRRAATRGAAALSLLLALLALPAAAQDGGWSVSGSLRVRGEAISGQFRPATAPDDAALLIRTVVGVEYDAGALAAGAELIDSRSYFEAANGSVSNTEVNALEPLQLYLRVDLPGDASIKLGRQTLAPGSRRLISRNNFRNTINAFTGVVATLPETPLGSAQLFWVSPVLRLPDSRQDLLDNGPELDRDDNGGRLFGGFVGRPDVLGGTVELQAIRLSEHDTDRTAGRDRHLWTLAVRHHRAAKPGRADWDVEGAAQWGSVSTGTAAAAPRVPVRAGFLHAAAGYTFARPWQPRLAIAFDYGSGDGRGRSFGRFDTLFGSRAFDWGPTSFYGALTRSNIVSPEARAEVTPSERWDAMAAVRPLWLANTTDSFAQTGVRDPQGDAGRWAGVQAEARVRWWWVPERVRLALGAALLAKGRFLEDAANAPDTGDTGYGYLELTVTP